MLLLVQFIISSFLCCHKLFSFHHTILVIHPIVLIPLSFRDSSQSQSIHFHSPDRHLLLFSKWISLNHRLAPLDHFIVMVMAFIPVISLVLCCFH